MRKTKEKFIADARKIHGDEYDYFKVDYKNNYTKVCIICPEHGEFWQTPKVHLSGSCCPKCSIERQRIDKEQFVSKAKVVHGNKYNYSKVNYVNYITKVCIVCSEHGEFWQAPGMHLCGTGCPKCNESKGERKIRLWLNQNNIKYLSDSKCIEWMVNNKGNKLKPDFYLPDYNLIIEFDGRQHFEPVRYIGMSEEEAELKFEIQQINDKFKNKLCEEHDLKIIRIPYKEFDNIEKILNKKILGEI